MRRERFASPAKATGRLCPAARVEPLDILHVLTSTPFPCLHTYCIKLSTNDASLSPKVYLRRSRSLY